MTYYSNKPRPMLEQPTLSYFIEDLENNVIEIKTERFKLGKTTKILIQNSTLLIRLKEDSNLES